MEVKFHPGVKEDLAEIACHYEAAERGLGHGFIEDYRETLALVVRDATVYRKFHGGLRKLNLHRFKAFAIVYEVWPEHIQIVAVADLRRKPLYWKDRL